MLNLAENLSVFLLKKINYPQFRKYPNNKSYFKIISENEFEELQFLGKKCKCYTFTASILPDRNFIYDLTFEFERHWLAITEDEYEEVKSKCS